MATVHDIFENPLLRDAHARRRAAVRRHVPALSQCPHTHYVSLFDYVAGTPQRFYSRAVYSHYLARLEDYHANDSAALEAYLRDNRHELSQAFLFLREANGYDWHDEPLEPRHHWERVRFIDRQVHPAYLRLLEGVLHPFAHLPAHFSRVGRGKSTEGLDLFNVVGELRGTGLDRLAGPYRGTVRNGIAHGGVTYLQDAVRYTDARGKPETLDHDEIVSLFDDLVDACNAAALALKVFLLRRLGDPYLPPQELLLDELVAETEAPWWRVEGAVPAELAGRKQLVVYVRAKTRDYLKVLWSAFATGVLAEFFAPGYDRYFLALRSPSGFPGWAAFDGRKLRAVREAGPAGLQDYKGALEDNLVFYAPTRRIPGFLRLGGSMLQAARLQWALWRADLRQQLGLPQIAVREAEVHRNGGWSVLNASVVVAGPGGPPDQELLRHSCGRAIRAARSAASRQCSLLSAARYLPLGYARIAVFSRDYRRRKLRNYGLGPDLVGTIQVKRIARIQAPDIWGAEVEARGPYRIAWNRAWLDGQGAAANACR